MRQLLLLLTVCVASTTTTTESRACMSEADLAIMRSNEARAQAAGCSQSIVRPGSAIGRIYLGEAAADALGSPHDGIEIDTQDGKVVRIRHAATNVCIARGFATPLDVVGPRTDLAPLASPGVALSHTAGGTRAEVTSVRTSSS